METSDNDVDNSDADERASKSDKKDDEGKTHDENEEGSESSLNDDPLSENFTLNEGVSIVGERLLKKDILKAVCFLQKVLDNYVDDEVFQ